MLFLGGCTLLDASTPTARFSASATEGAAPLTVFFDASSSAGKDAAVVAYVWEFGAGSFSTTKRFGVSSSYTFEEPGSYDVRLTVSDKRGKTATAQQTIVVYHGSGEFAQWLGILDWELVYDETYYDRWCVSGHAKNISDAMLRYVVISADFYDAHDRLLSDGIDIAFDLEPGAVWEFAIPLMDAEAGAVVDRAAPFVSGAEAYE